MTRLTSALVLVAVITAAGTGSFCGRARRTCPRLSLQCFRKPPKPKPPSTWPLQVRSSITAIPMDWRNIPAIRLRRPDGRPFRPVLASEDVSFDAAKPEDPKTPEKPEKPGARKVLYYRNPMGLPDTSPVPKKDGMGMDYRPVYDGEETNDGSVTISAGRQQLSGVKTALAQMGTIVRPVQLPGTVKLDERRISVLSTRTEAFVESVANVTTGDVIAEGQPLVSLYAREITTAGIQYVNDLDAAAANSTGGGRVRLENLGVPEKAITDIRNTRKVPTSITLTAPRRGVVLERAAVEGMMAAPGAVLFRIGDTSHVWVIADVPEYELEAVRKGAQATIKIRSLPEKEFKGKVDLIYPEIQSQSRTASIRIELPNPDGLLFANMYADVEIALGKGNQVVTVPDSAVIDSGIVRSSSSTKATANSSRARSRSACAVMACGNQRRNQ